MKLEKYNPLFFKLAFDQNFHFNVKKYLNLSEHSTGNKANKGLEKRTDQNYFLTRVENICTTEVEYTYHNGLIDLYTFRVSTDW